MEDLNKRLVEVDEIISSSDAAVVIETVSLSLLAITVTSYIGWSNFSFPENIKLHPNTIKKTEKIIN